MKRDNIVEMLVKVGDHYEMQSVALKNVIYGDTDSTYLDLSSIFSKESQVDDVITIADWIGEEVNSSFSGFIEDVFNIPKDRQHIIQTDREIVSDRGVFIKKKKYALHVINNEGKPCDKLKIMGLEIKKSDTPVVIQNFLKDLIDQLMHGKSFEDIGEVVDDFKSQYYQMSMLEIGNPKTVRVFSKYEKQIEENNGDMKGVPQHVKASIIYNSLRSNEDRPIYAGNKVKLVYTLHTNYQCIAIPSDLTELPEFLKDVTINYNRQWETVTNKIEKYLEAVELDKKSRNVAITNAHFTFD